MKLTKLSLDMWVGLCKSTWAMSWFSMHHWLASSF